MNDWRWNGNGSLYENFLMILNGISTTLTSIPLQKVLTRFWAMLEYLPMYGDLKNLVSVFTLVLFSSGLLSSFKFRYFFVTLLIRLVGNCSLFKTFVKFSNFFSNFSKVIKTYPCVVAPIQQSFNETIFIFRRCKLKEIVNKPIFYR